MLGHAYVPMIPAKAASTYVRVFRQNERLGNLMSATYLESTNTRELHPCLRCMRAQLVCHTELCCCEWEVVVLCSGGFQR